MKLKLCLSGLRRQQPSLTRSSSLSESQQELLLERTPEGIAAVLWMIEAKLFRNIPLEQYF